MGHTDDPEEREYNDIIRKRNKQEVINNPKLRVHNTYKLGEEVANGIKFWGQKGTNNSRKTTYMFICPNCHNLWRTTLTNVVDGKTLGCCRPKKQKET